MSDRHRYVCPSCRVVLRLREKDFPFRCQCGQRIESHHDIGLHLSMGIEALRQEGGPGSEFASLAASIGIHEAAGCDCQTIKREMDLLGVYGCRGRREQLLAKLRHNAEQYSWLDKLKAGWHLLRTSQIFATGITLDGLLDEAIRRAEAKHVVAPDAAIAALIAADPRDANWRFQREVLIAQRTLLDRVAAAPHQPPEWFAGRGIVTLGGTAKYFGAAWVLIWLLRKLGCTLPVEWFYLGPTEIDARMIGLAHSLGNVECVDLYERLGAHGRRPRRMAGWEAKVWAIMFSRFAEVLWLDADNVPARDPSFLFDEPEYRRSGAVFWPDFPPMGWSIATTAFEVARLPIPGRRALPSWKHPTDFRPFETGQILVNKSRHWPCLELTAAICDQSDFWFPHEHRGQPWWIYGDKDAFFLAWERMGRCYAMPPETADVQFWGDDSAGAFIQRDFAGEVLFQHRVQPPVKWRLHDENKQVPGTVHHERCLAALDDLRSKWIGHVYDAGDETPAEAAIAASVRGRKVWFRGDREPVILRFDSGGRTDSSQWHWTIRGEHMLLATFDRVIAEFGRDNKGNWVNHGTGNFLVDAPPEGFDMPMLPSEVAIFNDVNRDNEYRLPERFSPEDLILDVGGHCGSFAWACLSRGAGRVISVEPHPDNFQRLEKNLARFDRRSVLFLCTGNFYRSRYAEALFNHLAAKRGSCWRAVSRGLSSRFAPGPMMRQAAEALAAAGIPFDKRDSIVATAEDLAAADLIVAVKEAEHRPLLASRFPGWADRVRYWSIDDLDCSTPDVALPQLAARVEQLLAELPAVPPRSVRIPAAALDKFGSVHLAQPDGARHTGGWCAINVQDGIPAPALPFDQLVQEKCRLVKLDCEGSEWPILAGCTTWDRIDAWCGEYHLGPSPMPPQESLAWLRQIFESRGYSVTIEQHRESDLLGHFWASRSKE